LLSRFLLWRVLIVSILLAAAALGVFFFALKNGRDIETARTMVVNMFAVGEIFYLFNVRYLHTTSFSWQGIAGTPAVLIAIAALVVAQLLFTYAPVMNSLFESRPLGFDDAILIIVIGASLMVLLELEKGIMRQLGWFEDVHA
jgi:magnesium-transporting ATPase (P-type)